jgi:hypothetical protein
MVDLDRGPLHEMRQEVDAMVGFLSGKDCVPVVDPALRARLVTGRVIGGR